MDNILLNANYLINNSIENFKYKMSKKLDNLLVSYDGWFITLLAVLLAIAFSITVALAIWCLGKGKKFTENWYFKVFGFSVFAECNLTILIFIF